MKVVLQDSNLAPMNSVSEDREVKNDLELLIDGEVC